MTKSMILIAQTTMTTPSTSSENSRMPASSHGYKPLHQSNLTASGIMSQKATATMFQALGAQMSSEI
jgi:hypothetical protein